MKHLKYYENVNNKYINIALDISGSMSLRHVQAGIDYLGEFGEFDKINFIQFAYSVEEFIVLDNLDEIYDNVNLGGFGTTIQSLIDWIVLNKFDKYKTFIISDFYADNPDYSELGEYELIKLPDDIESVFKIPKDIKGEARKNIGKYNL